MTPIPDAAAGRPDVETHPMDLLALEVIKICNACLRGEISLDEWQAKIQELEQRGMMR